MLVNAVTGTGGLLGIMIPVWVVMAMVALWPQRHRARPG